MPVKAHASRTINAPTDLVWDVLDDFPAIASWSAGIQKSYTTGEADTTTGLGAERRCELGGKKILDERISAYEPGKRITIDIWNVEGLPLKSSQATFSVEDRGDGTTTAIIDAEAVPKLPGFVVSVFGSVLGKGFSKKFAGLLDELAAEAELRTQRAAS